MMYVDVPWKGEKASKICQEASWCIVCFKSKTPHEFTHTDVLSLVTGNHQFILNDIFYKQWKLLLKSLIEGKWKLGYAQCSIFLSQENCTSRLIKVKLGIFHLVFFLAMLGTEMQKYTSFAKYALYNWAKF